MHWLAELETKVYDPRKEKGKNTGNDVRDLPNKRKLWNWLYLQMLYTLMSGSAVQCERCQAKK